MYNEYVDSIIYRLIIKNASSKRFIRLSFIKFSFGHSQQLIAYNCSEETISFLTIIFFTLLKIVKCHRKYAFDQVFI